MTSDPELPGVLDAYQRDLGSRLDELAGLRQQAASLPTPAAVEIHHLLDVVTSSVQRGVRASGVLVQWLQAQDAGAPGAEPRAGRLQE